METKSQKPRAVTESGVFPRPDLSKFNAHESPEPRPAPAVDDPGSTSVNLPVVTEREDSAKQRDDSAAGRKR